MPARGAVCLTGPIWSDDQIGRFRELADAGVDEVMIAVPDFNTLDDVGRVIAAFRG